MRKFQMILVAAALMLVPVAVSAQTTASSDLTVTADVQRGLSMSPTTATLDFGTVVAGAADPTIAATSGSAVAFTVTGHTSHAIHFTFGTATLTNGTDDITYTPAVIGGQANAQGSALAITSGAGLALSADDPGAFYVWVGGSLNVPSTVSPGTYNGTWTLEVAY